MENHHQQQAELHSKDAALLNKKAKTLSIFRFLYFVAFLIVIVVLANAQMTAEVLIALAVFLITFIALVKWSNLLENKLNIASNMALFHQQELQKLKLDFSGMDAADEYVDQLHPYLKDLDIVGQFSLFQLLNTTATPLGKHTLIQWLSSPAERTEIIDRQEATKELTKHEHWRKLFFAHINVLGKKLKSTSIELPDKKGVEKNLLISLWGYFAFPLSVLVWYLGWVPAPVLYLVPIINLVILFFYRKRTAEFQDRLIPYYPFLQSMIRAFELVHKHEWESKKMQTISRLFNEQKEQRLPLKTLANKLEYLESRNTLFFSLLSIFFLFEYQLVSSAISWFRKYGQKLPLLSSAMAEVEALNSLAAWSARSESVFPTILEEEETQIMGEAIRHPLIGNVAVENPFQLTDKGSIMLITGSNMSGKSTYLRSLGINIVLAMAGAPVLAKSMSLPTLRLFTSMRKYDDLQSQSSTFYAELKRLQTILQWSAQEGNVVFYMLDEILNGTNSNDRHRGTESYMEKLREKKAFGIITTHDLELTTLEQRWSNVKNFSFNSQLLEGKIVFDYKLTEGPCRSFNAYDLMKSMGLA